jgi:Sulfotransferase domain
MTLRIVGAGLGRTGTSSLKHALERLTGGSCYHMVELFGRPQDTAVWQAAVDGEEVDWVSFFDGWDAVVDWPACTFWREIAAAHPDAVVLLSTRESSEKWWQSMSATILPNLASEVPPDDPAWVERRRMMRGVVDRTLDPGWPAHDAVVGGYERHNAAVRAEVDPARLCDWTPGDGWAPLCQALGVPEPDEPFPHTNTTADFNSRE